MKGLALAFAIWAGVLMSAQGIVINEIMYHPKGDNEASYEWLELRNDEVVPWDIGGWSFSHGIEFTFPLGTVMSGKSYLVICADVAAVKAMYGLTDDKVKGPFVGRLDNAGERIALVDRMGAVMSQVRYSDRDPWPAGADGTGFSLALISPDLPVDESESWAVSSQPFGSPGKTNGFELLVSAQDAVINEFLANTAGETFVELFNNSDKTANVGLAYLSDDPDNLTKYRIPEGTYIQPWQRVHFVGWQMGFQLPAKDGAVYLTSWDGQRIIDAQAYGTERLEMSRGRYPDGGRQWYTMHTPTPGKANEVSVNTSIVITEIMYHPYENDDRLECIELYNRGDERVDMTGWSFAKGVDFVFLAGTFLDPGEYLVVAKDAGMIVSKYGITNVIGNFDGALSNEGEKIELVDVLGNIVDEVRYAGGGRWPIWAAGWGSSMELIDPRQDNSSPSAWAASYEANRSEWTFVQYTGQFKGGESEFHFFLMHRGECLIDDISMKLGTTEFIPNGSFESGTTGWKIEGNHVQSRINSSEAHTGSKCLQIVATGHGDTGANRIECDTTGSLTSGQNYTISFWVKWQRGINLIYTRTHNQGCARASRFPMPDPRGTPGRRNTVYSANMGPVISDVTQNPIVPKSSEPVKVKARISDADGVSSATLYYKGDSDTSFTSVAMYDDGRHGDGMAGDAVYTGQIPARGATTLMEFYVVTKDTLSASQRFPAEDKTYCLYQIENTAPSTRLPVYRILLAREVDQMLRSRNRLSNELADCTFVLNNTQIYYNCGIRTRGSGWTRQSHPANQYRIEFNADQPLRGTDKDINLDWHADDTKQKDRTVHYLLRRLGGVPTSYHKYVHVRFNASFTALAEDVQNVDGEYVRFYWPDDAAGTLFEVDDHFEWNDSWSHNHWDAHLLWAGSDKELYRWNWEVRTNEKEDDYTEFLDLVKLMDPGRTSNTDFDAKAENTVHVDEWLKVLCVRFLVDDWDTFGYNRGKNADIYRPYHQGDGTAEDPTRRGRWTLIPWDSDLTFGNANAPIISGTFPEVQRMLQRPKFQRWYYCYYLTLVNGAFSRAEIDPVLDGVYGALRGESGQPSDPSGMKSFISSRISVILSSVPAGPKLVITTNSGAGFEVKEPSVTLEGTAPYRARTFLYQVNDGPGVRFEPTWKDSTHWRATFPVGAGENRFQIIGFDPDGKTAGKTSITIKYGLSPTEDSDGDGLFDREESEVYLTNYLNPDTDGDGLKDGDEVHIYLTDPTKQDTDGDTLPDGWEVQNNLNPKVSVGNDGADGDPDGDGLSNSAEYQNKTNPRIADTDQDGMSDSWEVKWGFNPTVATGPDGPDEDSDGDGLKNIEEYQRGTSPKSSDTDEDGLDDFWEVQYSLDPTSADGDNGPGGDPDKDGLTNLHEYQLKTSPQSNDTDRDQMDDRWEFEHNLDPTSAEGDDGPNGDPDGDGLLNLEEYQKRTNPSSADTDGDGMDDYWEMEKGLDPIVATGNDGADGDPDADGITNLQEYQYGLDPLTPNTDTDEDEMSDLWEINHGLSPISSEGDDGPEGDPDGDGSRNIEEMRAGTHPRSAESVFKVVAISNVPPSVSILWTTAENKLYRVLAADTLDGPWTAVADGIIGTGRPQEFSDEQAGSNGRRFYKVEVY